VSLALYRKYRPGSFSEVKGQDHVTGPLQQALRNGKVHHAYLFSGPRGCGKTSSARILARSLNCEKGPTPDPCGVCDSCVALAPMGPGSLDVVEIDAASHGGVDDARDLRERAFYAPVSSQFKIYIIDEAHMVSREGFNALLKLVEEPPDFLRFVFATTEPEKVLSTIRSRTHHYPFRLMPRRELTDLLAGIVEQEGVPVDPTVLPLVVRAAQGSARDGLSILDQVLASAGPEGVTRDAAAQLLGVTPDTLLDDVVDAFVARDGAAVFATVDRVMENGHDPRRFAADVLERLRDLVVLDAVPEAGEKGLLDCPPEQLASMARQATSLGSAGISRAADLFHAGLTEMRGTTSPRLLLELLCARVLLPAASSDDASVLTRLERMERRLEITGTPPPPTTAAAPAAPRAQPPAPAPASAQAPVVNGTPDRVASSPQTEAWPTAAVPGAAPQQPLQPPPAESAAPAATGEAPSGAMDAAAVRRAWEAVLDAVNAQKRTTKALLMNATVAGLAGRTLTLNFTTPALTRTFALGTNNDVLKDALRSVLGLDVDIVATSGGDAPPPPPTSAAGSPSAPQAPAPPPVPAYEGLAPGDEIEPEDPDDPKGERIVGGEDAAIALLQAQFGGKVIEET
jgi:DNA polymerase-3 subunit gamma/tau